ncbi:DUF4438 domain-containing protein [Humibacillus sp. DSM 29435]|uniref:DUF4438 family protein n=1 Tax=Humibacillus sp. DSM 29435 TaxID=1869167 RepID=UPI000872936B|nr:DUF4438 domain-containing protein [Humibacillus sp. DSM 29435]OFE14375.1 DUF4438 domain-containing protein [Humibacillus sp. DSM 29435]
MNTPTLVATNVAGVVEHPGLDNNPYLIDVDGRPYVPIGDGGVVLGISLGDSVFAFDTDHASAAVSLVHSDPAARYALTAFACLGNAVTVRSGAAAGAGGVVLGKRGEQGRVLAWFPPETLATIVPGDAMSVRAYGQGAGLSGALAERGAELLNVDPGILPRLGVTIGDAQVSATVRGVVGSEVVGNGLGRPAHQWDLDLQVDASNADRLGLHRLAIGDLVAVADLDVRRNAGYRRGWVTLGVVVTTTSPRPGHGVGMMPIFSAPRATVELEVRPDDHVGVSASLLTELAGR